MAIELKIAYIGGGSRKWAHRLMGDLALEPDLGGEIRLYDLDYDAAKLNETLGNRIQTLPDVFPNWRYRAVEQIGEALRGADFVFLSIQPGSLEMMAHEIAVAEKYGRFYPVGDTTGAPGLMRALRSAIIYAGFAEAIAMHCPNAWVLNFTNPMSVCTRTLIKVHSNLKVFGCCHEVFNTQKILAELAQRVWDLPEQPRRAEIRVNVLGINHFTWVDRATYRGRDLLAPLREHIAQPGIMRAYSRKEVEAQNNYFFDANQIKFTLFDRYGVLAAAGDRHLSEFVPGFVSSPDELFRWGVIRTPVVFRMQQWADVPDRVRSYLAGECSWEVKDSGEETIRQLRALVGLEDYITNVNVENVGQMPDQPSGAVVETNACFSHDQVRPLVAGTLPPPLSGLVRQHIASQEMIIDAALTRDKGLAFQAVFSDPTTHLPIDQTWAMCEEIGLPPEFEIP